MALSEYTTRVHRTAEGLPPLGKYVVCRYTGNNWRDRGDQQGCVWRVAKRVEYKVRGNDILPYRWEEFGPLTMFGHEVDLWFELPGEDQAV